MGQACIRIVTGEGKVIYIDPYSGECCDLPADIVKAKHNIPYHVGGAGGKLLTLTGIRLKNGLQKTG